MPTPICFVTSHHDTDGLSFLQATIDLANSELLLFVAERYDLFATDYFTTHVYDTVARHQYMRRFNANRLYYCAIFNLLSLCYKNVEISPFFKCIKGWSICQYKTGRIPHYFFSLPKNLRPVIRGRNNSDGSGKIRCHYSRFRPTPRILFIVHHLSRQIMKTLLNKHIVLGVSGSIAAYKAGLIVRELIQAGAEVRVVMTRSACEFVSAMTFQALSGHPVHSELLDEEAEAAMGHIALARWADLVVIAPASANTISRLAQGQASDLLSAVVLAHQGIVAVAPAMNQQMWKNPATRANIETLIKRGIRIFGPDQGEQACGEMGPGRMMEPGDIVQHIADSFQTKEFSGKTVLISAGPTREAIDPVRFISNRSSGKMGFALAEAVVEAGGRAILVSGPVNLATPARVERIDVVSSADMYQAVFDHLDQADVFIAAAAVTDYKPMTVSEHKIKKVQDTLTLELGRTQDILSAVARESEVFCVGFAAETEQLEQHAQDKLNNKDIDMIAANWVNRPGLGFDSDENALTVFWTDGRKVLEHATKSTLARQLIHLISLRLAERR